jgi:hypothetical protein
VQTGRKQAARNWFRQARKRPAGIGIDKHETGKKQVGRQRFR